MDLTTAIITITGPIIVLLISRILPQSFIPTGSMRDQDIAFSHSAEINARRFAFHRLTGLQATIGMIEKLSASPHIIDDLRRIRIVWKFIDLTLSNSDLLITKESHRQIGKIMWKHFRCVIYLLVACATTQICGTPALTNQPPFTIFPIYTVFIAAMIPFMIRYFQWSFVYKSWPNSSVHSSEEG